MASGDTTGHERQLSGHNLEAMRWREIHSRYFELVVPLQLVWGLFLFFPEDSIRSGFAFPAMVSLLGASLVAVAAYKFWFFLRRGDEYREMLRAAKLDDLNTEPTSAAFYWAVVATTLIGDFAFLYWGLSLRDQGAFTASLSPLDSVYFAVATFTTTGFGDVAPVSQVARLAVTVQIIAGFALVAVGLALVLSQLRGEHGDRP